MDASSIASIPKTAVEFFGGEPLLTYR